MPRQRHAHHRLRFINDAEDGLLHDYDVWLEKLAPHEPTAPTGNLPHASPSVRKFARELGVPLEEVKGTGPKGRITQEDVQAFTKQIQQQQKL